MSNDRFESELKALKNNLELEIQETKEICEQLYRAEQYLMLHYRIVSLLEDGKMKWPSEDKKEVYNL